MTDERTRRFVARINLTTGRSSVRETDPVDPRPTAPPSGLHRRAAPAESGPESAAPTFPWTREPVAEQPQPQDADRHNFPDPQPPVHVSPTSPEQLDDDQLYDRVLARVRESLGLPLEEPPIPILEPDGPSGVHHVAGAFFSDTNDVPAVQHPAGAFAETG